MMTTMNQIPKMLMMRVSLKAQAANLIKMKKMTKIKRTNKPNMRKKSQAYNLFGKMNTFYQSALIRSSFMYMMRKTLKSLNY